MAEMYARRVLRGDMEIGNVPAPWRDAAREIVERETGGAE
jgi:hypothetical protein